MKTNYFVIAALAATTLFASCDKDNSNNGLEENGKATTMKVSINFPTVPQTRATGDPNATDNEAEVKTVDVFVYYGNSGNFGTHKHLDASDFTYAGSDGIADKYTVTTKVPTTTGAKSVFAGINLPSSVVSSLVNQPMNSLYSTVQTLGRSDLTGTNGFVMFSTESVDRIFVEDENDPANNLTVKCQRLVAKVTVETSATVDVSGIPGLLADLQFAINNFNTKIFMMQGDADEYQDPNWLMSAYVGSDPVAAADFSQAVNADYAPVLSRALIANPTIDQYAPRYAAENTSEGKRQKEITRATVRATFIPRDITSGTTGNFTVNTTQTSTVQTFYAVTPSVEEGTSYFFNVTAANAFAAEFGGSVITYNDGYCYWNIFLNKNALNPTYNRWDVLRNDFYKCNITRIVAPGYPNPDVKDPEETPDVDTNISADIEILFWHTPIISDYVLE